MLRIILALALAVLAACPLAAETVDLGGRQYRADLPPHPQGAPILVALHGGGGNPAQFARNSGLSRVANAAGYAVIYPAGSGRSRLLTWNGGYCCGFAQRAGIDDVAFLDAVIADAARRYGLDAARVYMTGMSNGAIMTETYAALRPGAVRAIAAVSGTLDLSRFRPAGPVPLLAIHGTADPMVPYAGGIGKSSLTQTDFTPVADVVAAFVRANGPGLVKTTRVIDPAPGNLRSVETDWSRTGRPFVRLITVEGGGHVWQGGRRATGRDGANAGISANDEILRFFAAHP